MCTFVILRRPGHDWPLIVAANRDEMVDRPARPPDRHWADRPEVTAGIDLLSFGTWLGVNDLGMVSGILNRPGSLGPAQDRRSRGELPLEALDHEDARTAADALAHLDPAAYRPFNLIVADPENAFLIIGRNGENGTGDTDVVVESIPEGLSMVTAWGLNADRSARGRRYLPEFRGAPHPDPDTGNWSEWRALLARRDFDDAAGPGGAMCVVTDTGFGTVSSSLIAIPGPKRRENGVCWLFAAGRPGEVPFQPVRL